MAWARLSARAIRHLTGNPKTAIGFRMGGCTRSISGPALHGTLQRAKHLLTRYDWLPKQEVWMRSAILWFIGVPIPLILLLALCTHHF
jgi:hypothetical protein